MVHEIACTDSAYRNALLTGDSCSVSLTIVHHMMLTIETKVRITAPFHMAQCTCFASATHEEGILFGSLHPHLDLQASATKPA
jgi:hypothetical protein